MVVIVFALTAGVGVSSYAADAPQKAKEEAQKAKKHKYLDRDFFYLERYVDILQRLGANTGGIEVLTASAHEAYRDGKDKKALGQLRAINKFAAAKSGGFGKVAHYYANVEYTSARMIKILSKGGK